MNDLRAEHDAMLTRLSARKSTFHFAHAAVSIFVACVFGGAAWKLSLDLEYAWAPSLVLPATIVASLALAYGLFRLIVGRGVLQTEVAEFERLKGLRKQLKLDEPATFVAVAR
ncbi:MAG: hypothetical protein JNM69_22635 [Archangium sp.]|nr:hypothetical protein [Archangium sp.]